MLKRFILVVSFCICLFYNTSCQKDDNFNEDKTDTSNSEIYRCTVTHSFRKTGEGKKINTIFFAVPRSNDYQEITNYYNRQGEILTDTLTNEMYLKWDLSDDMTTESGDWFQISYEFDYIPKTSEFQAQIVGEIYPIESASAIHKMYTAGWYDEIDLNNPTILNVSQEIWSKSTDIYDYARRCFEYVDNFYYTDEHNHSVPLTFLLELGGGNCFQFSQILITLLRIKNIPARYVRTWQHTWAEFYLEKYGWIPADPTFSLFGIAPSGYSGEIVWNSNMTYHIENPSEEPNNSHCYGIHHVLPNDNVHQGYDCNMDWPMVKIQTSSNIEIEEYNISVYPNPAHGNLIIDIQDPLFTSTEALLYSISGKDKYFITVSDKLNKINISGFPKGMYILHIPPVNWRQKIIIE